MAESAQSSAFAVTGPVSKALEADLRKWVRRHGIVVWLDQSDHYGEFVAGLANAAADGAAPYEVERFRGSHLELMLSLENRAAGVDPPRLVLHLPGFNEESVRDTPLLELYLAGVRYRKRLDTLVSEAATGHVRQEEIQAFTGRDDLTLEGADAWLEALLSDRQGGLTAQLRMLSPTALIDDLLRSGAVAKRLGVPAEAELVWDHLATVFGLSDSWRATTAGRRREEEAPAPETVAFVVASWALSVEYVDDLRREPVVDRLVGMKELPASIRQTCRSLASHLRDQHPPFYRRTADETENFIDGEVDVARAEDLGRVDTFRFEEDKVLEAALEALAAGQWPGALEFARVRMAADDGGASFWLRESVSRHSAWELVAAAARLGKAVVAAGPRLDAKEHATAAERYVQAGAAVDRAHRELEQLRLKLLSPQLPRFETLRTRLDAMRQVWRDWADQWALDFNALCSAAGFLPPREYRQRHLFEDVVRPPTQEGKTAFFVVDALRFEMGAQLAEALSATPATTTVLRARFAELPTNTEIGMNVLAPVTDSSQRLVPEIRKGKFAGFSSGEYRVSDPGTRQRAMKARVGGDTLPWLPLAEVLARDSQSLKRAVAQANLLVVHSEEIDKSGEKGVGPAIFDTVMQQLRSAWQLLREAGVRNFVFTSDHGFLLLDGPSGRAQAHGRKIDPNRRHVLTQHGVDRDGEVRVSLTDLEYADADGYDLIFPATTVPFDTGKRKRTFVHGGNSLQERLIPVLTLAHRAAAGGSTLRYRVAAETRQGIAGMHCLRGRVEMVTSQGSLSFGGAQTVELTMAVPDSPGVTAELCQARDGAQLVGGILQARVGEDFELFFRLQGQTAARARVVLRHPSQSDDVQEGGPPERFAVAAAPQRADEAETSEEGEAPAQETESAPAPASSWLESLPKGGVRQVFAHIEAHGSCREDEAAKMLGGQRQLRRFSAAFESYAALAPFEASIEVLAGVKRYVKEGSGT